MQDLLEDVEFNPNAAKATLLKLMSKLGDHCAHQGDRTRLLMAFELFANVEFEYYE